MEVTKLKNFERVPNCHKFNEHPVDEVAVQWKIILQTFAVSLEFPMKFASRFPVIPAYEMQKALETV